LIEDRTPSPEPLVDIVVRQLQGREPIDEREARSRTECLVQLGRLAAPFDRDADPTHVTGSGLVVGGRGVLLLLHRRLHIWVQPGGHLEGAESPWDAARRETMEETGLAVRLVGADPIPRLLHVDVQTAGPHVHLDLRYLLAVDGDDEPRPPPGESQDVRWMSWSEAVATADVGLSGLLRVLSPAP
jgi:8-oxo-dGTP pyrophosphatase MutT (NUDIX family)